MKILCFIPYGRLETAVVQAITQQEGVEYFDIWFAHDNPYTDEVKGAYKNMQFAYEKMRQIVLNEGYEAVWIVEADTIPPKDALKKLLEVDAPVVSGLYALRHGTPAPNIRNHGGAWPWEHIKRDWGKTVEVTGGCMGCLLVRKEVLKDFSMIDNNDLRAPDGRMMNYCVEKKIKQMARLDVVCGHVKINGDILYPDQYQGYRLEKKAA